MPVVPGPGKPRVIFAVYGGLRDGSQDNAWETAEDVTDDLQTAINRANGEIVKIDNNTMGGDPAKKVPKQFGAIVEVKGNRRPFACLEGQTIDFT
jgi:hypothetical protein